MTKTLQAPVDRTAPVKLGRRLMRKQILRKGTIDYPLEDGTTRAVTFDDAYLDAALSSYQAGAYDSVPFILADEKNQHTLAPERFRGWVKGLERTADGIDAVIELSEDAAELVDRTDGLLGVSPRLKAVRHVDGRTYPVAVHHVLGTLDPRLQGPSLGLKPWQAVDLSDTDDDVLDLSGATYRKDRAMPRTLNLDTLDPDVADSIVSFAAMQGVDLSEPDADNPGDGNPAGPEPGPAGEPGADPVDPDEDPDGEFPDDAPTVLPGEGDGNPAGPEPGPAGEPRDDDEAITDADLEALIDAELGVSLSNPADTDTGVDLAASYAAAGDDAAGHRSEAASLRFQLASRDYVAAGVPPVIVDLAAPILALSEADTLDLSTPDGEAINVRRVVSDMLDAMRGTVDLSSEAGHGLEVDPDAETDPTTQAWLDNVTDNI